MFVEEGAGMIGNESENIPQGHEYERREYTKLENLEKEEYT